jgi:phosphoglycolate phosphatase
MNAAILFDLDGTLIDTPSGIVETFIATMQEMGRGNHDSAAIRATIGMPLPKAFGDLLGCAADAPEVTHAVGRYQALFRTIVLPKADSLVFPGVLQGLESLRGSGYRLAVATSKVQASAESLLHAANLSGSFDLVVGADRVTHPKPHPEMGIAILRTLQADATKSWMIGDTTHDLFMAHAAGLRSIAVTYGVHALDTLRQANPTCIVDHFGEIPGILDRRLAVVGTTREETGHLTA